MDAVFDRKNTSFAWPIPLVPQATISHDQNSTAKFHMTSIGTQIGIP